MRRIAQTLAVAGATLAAGLAAVPAAGAATAAAAIASTPAATARSSRAAAIPAAAEQARARALRLRGLLGQRGAVTGLALAPDRVPAANICVRAFGGGITRTAFTGPDGRFVISGLPLGGYRIEYRGCSSIGRFTGQWYGDPTGAGAATVQVTAGAPVQLATVTLGVLAPEPGQQAAAKVDGSIRGTVTNASGAPLGGICVEIAVGPGFGAATTKANGSYRISGLAAGSYQIEFVPGGQFSFCGNNGNYLPAIEPAGVSYDTVTTLNAVLPTGGVITGVVRDTRGKPLSGICVFSNGRNPFASQIVTDSQGAYRVDQLPTGSYDVGFSGGCGNKQSVAEQAYRNDPTLSGPTAVTVTQGKITASIDADMQPGGTLTGRITDQAGRPLSDICVFVSGATGAGANGLYGVGVVSRHGTYSVTNMPPGQFTVLFSGLFAKRKGCGPSPYADQQFAGLGSGAQARQVGVPAGRVTEGVDATMAPSGKISGVVRSKAGKPEPGICVTATDKAAQAIGQATSQGRGKYLITDLPAGRYKVEFTDCEAGAFGSGQNFANQWYKDTALRSRAASVIVRAGSTTPGIDAALTTGGGIAGQVVYVTDDRPVSSACVYAFTENFSSFSQSVTDRRGNYDIAGLSTGRYVLEFTACSYESALAAQIRPGLVSVVAGHLVRGIGETLEVGGSISGVARYAAGSAAARPAPGTCVEVLPLTATGVGYVTSTGPGGGYLVTNLAPGPYLALFGDPYCSNDWPVLAATWSARINVNSTLTVGGVSATLDLAGGLGGTVSGPHGGIAGICAQAVPQPNSTPAAVTSTAVAISGAGGRYQILGLQPGRYKVEFTTGCGATGYATRWYKDATGERGAAIIKITKDTVRTGIDGTLPGN